MSEQRFPTECPEPTCGSPLSGAPLNFISTLSAGGDIITVPRCMDCGHVVLPLEPTVAVDCVLPLGHLNRGIPCLASVIHEEDLPKFLERTDLCNEKRLREVSGE